MRRLSCWPLAPWSRSGSSSSSRFCCGRASRPTILPPSSGWLISMRASRSWGNLLAKAQSQLQQTVHERLDAVTARLGESMQTSTKHTAEHLQQLHARLAVIDSAQRNITDLASQMTSPAECARQQAIARRFWTSADGNDHSGRLAKGLLRIPGQRSPTRHAPIACVHLPDGPSLVIDAKFPLEAVTAFREAKSDEERKPQSLAYAQISPSTLAT